MAHYIHNVEQISILSAENNLFIQISSICLMCAACMTHTLSIFCTEIMTQMHERAFFMDSIPFYDRGPAALS